MEGAVVVRRVMKVLKRCGVYVQYVLLWLGFFGRYCCGEEYMESIVLVRNVWRVL
jgi:hypothetical protein